MTQTEQKFTPDEIEELETRLTKKIDDLKGEFYSYKEEMEGKIEDFMEEQRKFAKKIGEEVVLAFKNDFTDKYVSKEVYEERKRTEGINGRYRFLLGCVVGILTLLAFLGIIASTIET